MLSPESTSSLSSSSSSSSSLPSSSPESELSEEPPEGLSEELDSLESESPKALDSEFNRESLHLFLRLVGASMNAVVAASSTSSLTLNRRSSKFSSSSSLQSKGTTFLGLENLRRQRANGKRERGVHMTWWWGRSMVAGSTLRGA